MIYFTLTTSVEEHQITLRAPASAKLCARRHAGGSDAALLCRPVNPYYTILSCKSRFKV